MISLVRPCLAVGVVVFGLLLSAGCKRDNGPDTGIIVEVTTDLRVPGDINQVHLTAEDSQGNILHEETFDLGEGPNRFLPPFRVGIYPLQDTATPIHIEAVGQLDTASQPVASRSATLSFIQGKKVILQLPLLAVCKNVTCKDASLTCRESGRCEPDNVDSSTLPTYVPNQPVPEPDAATVLPDAATPADVMDAAAEKVSDSAADRTGDLAPDVAGGRDTFSATGGAGGTDAPSGTGGAIGTGGATAAVDARTEVGDTTGADAPPDVPVGGSGGMGGTPATGGIAASGGKTTAGGTTTTGGTTASGGTTSSGGTATTGGTTASGGTTSSGGTTTSGGTIASGGTTSAGGTTATGGTTTSGGTISSGGITTSGGTTASGGTTSAGGTTTAGGTIASGGTTSSGGTTTAGGTIASGGSSGKGGTWGGTAPSCSGLAATCGPSGTDDCCNSLLVPGGTFDRSYDGVDFTDPNYPATVDDFYLDKYEITVGRFRQFVNAGMGTQKSPPAAGAGAHPGIDGSGWDSTWNANLPADPNSLTAAIKCYSPFQTWTDTPGDNESRPQNCMDWYTAFAFCAWDGGRLATDAELNYASAGGSEQREYPWGSAAPDPSKASYFDYTLGGCNGNGNSDCVLADLIVVGTKPGGNGRWGHADLAGNVWEWTLDWYATYQNPCDNCANLTDASDRVIRGGGFYDSAYWLGSATRDTLTPGYVYRVGGRCARTSL
jgi:formylglycine-generating enzyme required for sulfatase activity